MPRRWLLFALLIAGLAISPLPTRAAGTSRAAAGAKGTPRSTASARAAGARAPGATGKASPRRLEDVTIEGEIPVPQVLFVTAREQRRMLDFQHRRYLSSSKELAEATPLPRWIAVPPTPPAADGGAHR